MKMTIVAFILVMSIATYGVSSQTLVEETYTRTFSFNLLDIDYDSCNIDENWQNKMCSYLKLCYVVVPKGQYEIGNILLSDCIDVTDEPSASITVNFVPPRGKIYAVFPFVAEERKTYNDDILDWEEEVLLVKYQAESIVTLCPEGQMLKDNLCFNAQPFCLDTFGTNLCNNPYDLYILDLVGDGFDNDFGIPSHACADRDQNHVCDGVASMLCSDTNGNGVCDEDDVRITEVSCIDANQNGICDDVETEGTFCRTNFQPVCDESSSVTYPNSCFAEASGVTVYTDGVCDPIIQNLCYSDTDCSAPCDGVVGVCQNPDGNGNRCFYTGECNPTIIQCSVDFDCPEAPCIGVTPSCVNNHCEYSGECITKPEPNPSFIDFFLGIWNYIIGVILDLVGF